MDLIHKCLLCVLIYKWQEKSTDYELRYHRKPLKVYWNVPSFQCDPFKLNFTALMDKYGLIHNGNNKFRGDNIVILYDPGNFPAILMKGNETVLRNGGVPQEGNLTYHLEIFSDILEQLVPKRNFSGIGVIDFESWRPIFRQNFGTLVPYKTLSIDIERQRHPTWPKAWIEKEAIRRFEEAGKKIVKATLLRAKELRPLASWGYYAYPYCFNMAAQTMARDCSKIIQEENNKMSWLFNFEDSFHPSLYLYKTNFNTSHRVDQVKGRLNEAQRINKLMKTNKRILPYYWYKYGDTNEYLSKEDLFSTLTVLTSYDIDGVVLWGSSMDVNSKAHCVQLYDYVDKILGPLLVSV